MWQSSRQRAVMDIMSKMLGSLTGLCCYIIYAFTSCMHAYIQASPMHTCNPFTLVHTWKQSQIHVCYIHTYHACINVVACKQHAGISCRSNYVACMLHAPDFDYVHEGIAYIAS